MQNSPTDVEYWNSIAHSRPKGLPDDHIIIHHNAQKSRVLLREILLHNMQEKRVLEVGCGSGMVAAIINKLYSGGWKYLGTDISDKFLYTADKVNKLQTIQARSTNIPVKDASADYVFMFDVFEHIHPDEREATAREIARILRVGGVLIMNSPMLESQHNHYDYGLSPKDGQIILCDGAMENIKRKVISYSCEHDPFRMYLYEEFRRVR